MFSEFWDFWDVCVTWHCKYVESKATMNSAWLISEPFITSGTGLNLKVNGIYWPATVGWPMESQSRNRGDSFCLLFTSAIHNTREFYNAWGAALIPWPMHGWFLFEKDERGPSVVFKKSKWINSRQSSPTPHLLAANPKQDLKMIDLSATFS